MKKVLIAFMISALGVTALTGAIAAEEKRIVVDRSTRSKVLTDYTLLTRDAIQKAWVTPLDLKVPAALKGRIRINYAVTRDGDLASVRLVKGSGNSDMDRSLMSAIRSAKPFPQFPDEIEADSILIRANFIIADLPTEKASTVSQPIASASQPSVGPTRDEGSKKLKWGLPAGSADDKADSASKKKNDFPVQPKRDKKYRWGARPL
jgi:TonB family protein